MHRGPFFVSKTDELTLLNPTRDKTAEQYEPTAESLAWPELSMVNDLVAMGVPLDVAWEMPPNTSMKLTSIRAASLINPKNRVGGSVMGTMADLRRLIT